MTRDEIIAAWNAQSDYMNSWQNLGEDEKLEWAIKLEREACWRLCDALWLEDKDAHDCREAIRTRSGEKNDY
jgi:hypothetical protein